MITVTGELELVGEGLGDFQSRSNHISVIRMGNESVRNVHITQDLSSFLQPGDVREIFIHKLLGFRKMVIGLRLKNGRKELVSLGRLLGESLGVAMIGAIIAGVGGTVVAAILASILGNWIAWPVGIAAFGWWAWEIFSLFRDYSLAKAA